MAPQPSTSSRGHLWNVYKHFYQHRHVEDSSRKGIITRRVYSTKQLPSQVPCPQDKFEVLWWNETEGKYDDSRPDLMLYPALEGIVTDQFVKRITPFTPPVIKHVILPLQESNWVASDEKHAAMLAKAKEASRELRAQGKTAEKELDQLIAVTEEEQGLPPKPPKREKPAKKPSAAGAQAAAAKKTNDKKPAARKGKAAAAAGAGPSNKAAAAVGAGPSSKAAAAVGAGPSSKAAAAGGKKPKEGVSKKTVAAKVRKSVAAAAAGSSKQAAAAAGKNDGSSGLGSSSAEAEDSKTLDASEDDELSSDFESLPSGKGQSAAAAASGKKRKQQQQPGKPEGHQEKAAKKQKTAAAAAAGGGSTSKGVKGVTGRVYPADVVCAAGDRRLGSAEYAEGNEDVEYPVERIVDEVEIVGGSKGKVKKQVKVLPKWQGYELDPHGWEDKGSLKETDAYVKWAGAAKKPAYFTAVSNDSAAKAYVLWSQDMYKASKKKK